MTRPTFKIAFCLTGDLSKPFVDWWSPVFRSSFRHANLEFDNFVVAVQPDDTGLNCIHGDLSPKGFLHLVPDVSARMIAVANDQRRVDFWNKDAPVKPVTLESADALRALNRVAALKRDVEIDGRFEYDICVHITPRRPAPLPDRIQFPKENHVSVFGAGFNHEFLGWKFNPDLFYARSMEFDILSRAFDFAHVLKPVAFNHKTVADLGNILYFFAKVMHLDINAVTKS